ncbi:EPHA3 [Acrasis kona]|uniref:EPHA3 n=1 Tax=Acrasis kona TaxID=1008807 RepID=A0AAW2Z841_9EUKA
MFKALKKVSISFGTRPFSKSSLRMYQTTASNSMARESELRITLSNNDNDTPRCYTMTELGLVEVIVDKEQI